MLPNFRADPCNGNVFIFWAKTGGRSLKKERLSDVIEEALEISAIV